MMITEGRGMKNCGNQLMAGHWWQRFADCSICSHQHRSQPLSSSLLFVFLSLPACEAATESEAGFQFVFGGYMVMFIGILYMCCSPHCQVHDPGFRPPEGA